MSTSASEPSLRTPLSRGIATLVVACFIASCAASPTNTDEKPTGHSKSATEDDQLRDCGTPTTDQSSTVDQLEPFRATGPIATVDGRTVPARIFNLYVLRHPPRARGNMPDEMIRQMKRHTVRDAVAFDLLARNADVGLPPERLDSALREFRSKVDASNNFSKFLERHAIDVEDVRWGLCRKLVVEASVRQRTDLDVSEERLRQYYRQHRDSFTRPGEKSPPPFSEVRRRVTAEVRSRRLDESRRQLVDELRRKHDIEYHYDRVETTLSTAPGGRSLPAPSR